MIPLAAESLGESNMSNWIEQHPYLFMTLMIYTITSISHMVTRIAMHKYSYRPDE